MASLLAPLKMGLARRATFATGRRIRLYDKLSQFTANGVPLVRSLRNLQRRFDRDRDHRAPLFRGFIARLEEGEDLSSVWSRHIPTGERLLIQSGEDSGKIHLGLAEAKRLAEIMKRLKSALIAELTYPLILFLLLCAMLTVISLKLVPVLIDAIPRAKWPSYSQGLYTLSNVVLHAGPFIVGGVVLAIVVSMRSLPRWRGPVRENLDRWCPPYSIYREMTGASFLIALSSLVGSGQAVSRAVERLTMSASPWLKVHLNRMQRSLLQGTNPGIAMRTGIFGREVEDDIEDYSQTSNFDEALKRVGADQVDEAIGRITARASVLRVVMLVMVLGVLLYVYSAAAMVGVNVAKEGMNMAH